MADLDGLLAELGELDCVRGCALVTSDGILVKERLAGRYREDVVSGLTSFLVQTTKRALSEHGEDPGLERFVLHATHGKIVTADIGGAWLVAITDQFARLSDLEPTFDSIAARMSEATHIHD